jgi:hypothetical protein
MRLFWQWVGRTQRPMRSQARGEVSVSISPLFGSRIQPLSGEDAVYRNSFIQPQNSQRDAFTRLLLPPKP